MYNVPYGQVLEEDARSTARKAKLSKDHKLQGKSLLSLLGEDPEFGQNSKAIYKRIQHASTKQHLKSFAVIRDLTRPIQSRT